MNALAGVLPKLNFLEILLLDNNEITSDGMKEVNFHFNSKLRILSFSRNELTKDCMHAFENINFACLEKLILSNNKIGSAGALKLLHSIDKVSELECKLTEINLSNTGCDEAFDKDSPILFKETPDHTNFFIDKVSSDIELYEQKFRYCPTFLTLATMLKENKFPKIKMVNFSQNNLSR